MSLKNHVQVLRRFQRAIRLDTDLDDPLALQGFVCPPTFAHALSIMAQQIAEVGHSAFTWTGPFGGGKSSLAVVLAALLGAPGKKQKLAMSAVGNVAKQIIDAIKPGRLGYRSIAVVGRKQDCAGLIADALKRARLIREPIDTQPDGGILLLKKLIHIANNPKHSGLIIFIDEMDKVLEAAAQGRGDLHFLQELAEIAARSERRLIVIGILHQAFGEYTWRLTRQARDEWMKVQGRFIDIPLATVADEQLVLLSQSIQASNPPTNIEAAAHGIAGIIKGNRTTANEGLAQNLIGCWPLHPITACLLGPYSRRRFGQNQRSMFSFLNSAESHGFQAFLGYASSEETYLPARLWDYLRDNLEPAILVSPDGHRWSTAVEALDRCESHGGSTKHVLLVKTIAIIDWLRDRTGLYVSKEVLRIATPAIKATTRTKILRDLERWSIIAYRRHLGAYAIFAGSDFQIEVALDEERNRRIALDYSSLQQLAEFKPVIAKRHYHRTGARYWMDCAAILGDELEARIEELHATVDSPGTLGVFLMVLPSSTKSEQEMVAQLIDLSKEKENSRITLGIIPSGDSLVDLAQELAALERIQTTRIELELGGDEVARREVTAHFDATKRALQLGFHNAFLSMTWYSKGKQIPLRGLAGIHRYVSDLAAEVYPEAPRIPNELLNRIKPSGTAVAARRQLMYAMVKARGQERLGFEGYPAEAGLFTSLLAASNLYGLVGGQSSQYTFQEPPADSDPANLGPIWACADEFIASKKGNPVCLADILDVWKQPPYGVRDGLLPVFALAYILSRVDRLAVYVDGVFRPSLDDWLVDRMHQEWASVQIRRLNFGKLRTRVLEGIFDIVAEYDGCTTDDMKDDPLTIARRLVAIVFELPVWTQRTTTISQPAQRLRNVVLSASDPHRFLFDDLPGLMSEDTKNLTDADIDSIITSVRSGLKELIGAYPKMLKSFADLVVSELGVDKTPQGMVALQKRAENILGLSGDFRLDSFAARLVDFSEKNEAIEGIASLAMNKPPKDWVDRDLDAARLEIAALSQKFNRCEAFARVKGRADYRHAVAFIVGMSGSPTTVAEEFEIDSEDANQVSALARDIQGMLQRTYQPAHIALAALAQVGTDLLSADSSSKKPQPHLKEVLERDLR